MWIYECIESLGISGSGMCKLSFVEDVELRGEMEPLWSREIKATRSSRQ
jgi:hypothetical protein